MGGLPTVLLEHTTDSDRHYDWLFANPDAPATPYRLTTWRVTVPPWRWPDRGELELVRLPDHRRVYLEYEGPLTRGRGFVRRVDAGELQVERWSAEHAAVVVFLRQWRGRVLLRRTVEARWVAGLERAEQER